MAEMKSAVPPYQQEQYNMVQPQLQHDQGMMHEQQNMHQPGMIQQDPQPNYGNEVNKAPMQQMNQYKNATPLASIGQGPTPVDCPSCGVRAVTRVEYQSGNTTYAWALGLCVCFCLGCIPFLMSSLKDVVHYCSHCGTRLATWHRSGAVEVHAHA